MMYQFALESAQVSKLSDWLIEHDKSCKFYDDGTTPVSPTGAIGGRLTYEFTPTSLGTVSVVKCACGESINLTDYKSW